MDKSLRASRMVVLAVAVVVVGTTAAGAADSSRWYLVGKAGQSGVDERYDSAGFGGWGVDGEELSGGVELGYAFHRNLSFQGGYHYLGGHAGFSTAEPCVDFCPLSLTIPTNPSEARFHGVSVSVVPRWEATERLTVHGKLGLLGWESDLTFDFGRQELDAPSGEDMLAGAGAEYRWAGGAGLLLEYEHAGPFDVLSLGGTWRF